MPNRDVVGVACSAGGLAPLRALVAGLPADFPAPVLVVRHLAGDSRRLLPSILADSGPLPAAFAEPAEPLRPGHVQIAPPGHHMVVRDGRVRLARGPRINRVRPAADALFRSLARFHGPRAVVVVLSGSLDDGTAGAAAVAARGGTVVVQEPAEADHPSMPSSALAAVPGALIVPDAKLAETVRRLIGEEVEDFPFPPPEDLVWETDVTELSQDVPRDLPRPGLPAPVSCPACFGTMNRVDGLDDLHYRCHVGHVYSPLTLLADQARAGDSALWHTVALLEEQAAVRRELAHRAGAAGRSGDRATHLDAALAAKRAADAVRAQIPDEVSVQDPTEEA